MSETLARNLIERALRQNGGNRERAEIELFYLITREMSRDSETWIIPPAEIRRRVRACVDEVLEG